MVAQSAGSIRRHPGSPREVLLAFLRLGITSFGGPIAHLAYFHTEFVERRTWLTDRAYADLVALCQLLPGPASSQVGMAIGLQRAGLLGLCAAWVGFTLPSAVALLAFALGVGALGDLSQSGWVRGLQAAAVGVVAHAVLSMARSLTPDRRRATIAVGMMLLVLFAPGPLTILAGMVGAGVAGTVLLKNVQQPAADLAPAAGATSPRHGVPRGGGVAASLSLAAFALLALALPALAATTGSGAITLFDTFYRAGALVFGGGHVVLPLLQAELVEPGLVPPGTFLTGYAAAQAVPGPLFTFSAFLGAVTSGSPSGLLGATIALFAVFLPAALLVVGALPLWGSIRHAPRAQRALLGVNAGVVGLLAAALYTPVFTEGITGPRSLALAAVAFVALTAWRAPSWAVVIGAACVGAVLF